MGLIEVFAANVRRYREAAGLSQEALADKAGVSRPYFGRIENRANVTLRIIEGIAEALGVDPAVLLLSDLQQPRVSAPRKAARTDGPEYEYALVQWTDDSISIRPLDVRYDDLTIQILLDLIERGHRGDELVKAYQDVSTEIIRFFRGERE